MRLLSLTAKIGVKKSEVRGNMKTKHDSTERLIIRPLKMADAEAIFDYRSDKANFPFVDMPPYSQVTEAYQYIEKMNQGMNREEWFCYALVLKSTDELVGTLSVWNFDEDRTQAELGFGLFPAFRGMGLMSEALEWAVRFSGETLQLKKLEAYTSVDNEASKRSLSLAGFDFEKEVLDTYGNPENPPLMAVYKVDLDVSRGKVLITGAGSGLGEALALLYAHNGYHVILVGRELEKIDRVKKNIKTNGGLATAYVCDVTDIAAVTELAKLLKKKEKRILKLINNAGVGVFGAFETIHEDEIDLMINTNLKGTMYMTKALLPILSQGVINIISTAGLRGKTNEAVYCATKFAVRGFTESLQLELKDQLQVTAVYMGGMNTPFWHGSDHIEDKSRLKTAEEVAQAIFKQDDGRASIEIH